MKRWLITLLLACSCGPCCPCGDDFPCDAAPPSTSLDHDYYAASNAVPVAVQFNWSPPAAHHAAVVQVQAANQAGSGVYVEVDGVCMILTCAHVVGTMDGQGRIVGMFPQATATFRDGVIRSAAPRNDKDGHDIAGFVVTRHPSIKPLKVSDKAPSARVEMLGYAGREGRLRHWWGGLEQGGGETVWYTAGVGSGDSGGPVLTEQRELVGLLAHGDPRTQDDTDGWRTYRRAGGPAWTPLRNFAIRLRAFGNPSGKNPPLNERPMQGGCPGGICPPQPQPYGEQGGGLYPPPPPYQDEPQPTPAQPGCQCPDYSGRLSAIEADIEGLKLLGIGKGEKGDKGDRGEAADTEAIMAAMKAELNAWLVANRESLRGPSGPPGRDGSDGIAASPSTDKVTHAVLVVDRSANYWPRLSVSLERARQRFNGIRISPPPEFATQLPAIVFYENGKPVLVRKGEREVTQTLTAIERGEISFLQES